MNHKAVRSDLSEWVIHFVHERKPESETSLLQDFFEPGYTGEFKYPDYFDSFGEGQCIFSTYDENEYKIPRDANAFQVLLKILHDGFLHSGWSRRNGSPTIYGPRSAVCFTEMPLHAFLMYADDRGKKTGFVSRYAIALKKKELFNAGGRPVIYGLSSPHVESGGYETGVYQGRCLSVAKTGLGLQEQYRYVATSLDTDPTIDWTHEREWRWPLPGNSLHVPGLPLFLDEYYGKFFSEILIFVETGNEKNEVLNYLKTLHDSGSWNNGIPFSVIDSMPEISVSTETLTLVTEKLAQAIMLADKAMIRFREENPGEAHREFDCGWTYICTSEVNEISQALVSLGFTSYADGIYRKNIISHCRDSLTTQAVGAGVAADYLTEELGQDFYVMTHQD